MKTNEPKPIVCIMLMTKSVMHAKCCSLDQKPEKYFRATYKTNYKQHFSELQLNHCVEKMQFSMVSECNQPRFIHWHILSEDHTNTSQCEQFLFSFLLLLSLFPHPTLCLVDICCVLPSLLYQRVSCAAMLECTGHVLCLAFLKIVYCS